MSPRVASGGARLQRVLALVPWILEHPGVTLAELAERFEVDEAELAARRAAWRGPAPRYTRGVLAKFANNASSASRGAVLDAGDDMTRVV